VIDKLETVSARLRELDLAISDPNLTRDPARYKDVMRERSRLALIDEAFSRYKTTLDGIEDARSLLKGETDQEMREMVREEQRCLEAAKDEHEAALRELLVPRDPLADKSVIMEIRAGTGGEEAALFAADLYRMYSRYADGKGWKVEVLDASESGLGGFREIVFSVTGDSVFENLRWESGVHRVQRVPATEASGRIHTSAVTVAVLPEMEETEIDIRAEDLRIDSMRAGGPGGQCVNTTDSAIRITHLPTGIVVQCQDEKSQIKNKAKAMRVLRARLYEHEESKRQAERAASRKSQIGSGDRSERIRTYNFPQNRLTDHRINLTLYKLELVMEGDLGEMVAALVMSAREDAMREGQA
jgi:peptide chain release factor 1